MCGASGARNECQESMETIFKWASKGSQIIINQTSGRIGGVLRAFGFMNAERRADKDEQWSHLGATWSILCAMLAPRADQLGATTKTIWKIMTCLINVPLELESANNEQHRQNEGPIHLAFPMFERFPNRPNGGGLTKLFQDVGATLTILRPILAHTGCWRGP